MLLRNHSRSHMGWMSVWLLRWCVGFDEPWITGMVGVRHGYWFGSGNWGFRRRRVRELDRGSLGFDRYFEALYMLWVCCKPPSCRLIQEDGIWNDFLWRQRIPLAPLIGVKWGDKTSFTWLIEISMLAFYLLIHIHWLFRILQKAKYKPFSDPLRYTRTLTEQRSDQDAQ